VQNVTKFSMARIVGSTADAITLFPFHTLASPCSRSPEVHVNTWFITDMSPLGSKYGRKLLGYVNESNWCAIDHDGGVAASHLFVFLLLQTVQYYL
jgi:hypothetical protein